MLRTLIDTRLLSATSRKYLRTFSNIFPNEFNPACQTIFVTQIDLKTLRWKQISKFFVVFETLRIQNRIQGIIYQLFKLSISHVILAVYHVPSFSIFTVAT